MSATETKKATGATSETIAELFHEAMRSYEKALKSGIQLQEESVNLWKELLTKLGSPEELQAKLESMTADAFPKARKRMEEFVETFNRTSNQTIDLFEKTLGVYQVTSVTDAQRRVQDLIESSLTALRVNVHSALNIGSPPFDEMRKMRGGMLKVLAETRDEYMRTLNGALDLKRTARDGMNIEEPGLDTYKVGTVPAASNGAVNMHSIKGQVAAITKDALAVRIDKQTGRVVIYPMEDFRKVVEINMIAPIYWAIELVAAVAKDRASRGIKRWQPEEGLQGAVVFLGSIASIGNVGQISYSSTKAGLEGAASTLMAEAMYYGVRCSVIHPGFTDTPMVRALGEEYIRTKVLPHTQLKRLIKPEEIADAICFMVTNAAVSGELWADAGWRPAT